jgi:hypothetical protein
MFGPHLVRLTPDFIDDLWDFVPTMGQLFLRTPRWLMPEAYRRRDRLLEGILRWHKYAREHFDESAGDPDWEECYGSRFSKARQDFFAGFEAFDARACAADDLSFIWA